jgi:hypothetical protein
MSNKSRSSANKSRFRLTMAAGAILAGAAIPIAAAGTAWADEAPGSGTPGPSIGISVDGKTIMHESPYVSVDGQTVMHEGPYVYDNHQSPETAAT